LGDVFEGNGGADTFLGAGGNDTLIGGAGQDVAFFLGNLSEYDITETGRGAWKISSVKGGRPDGVDTLRQIEEARFNDGVRDLTLSGSSSGVFANPSPAGSPAVFSGVGTPFFTWGEPLTSSDVPSRLTFIGTTRFDPQQFDTVFPIGVLSFTNGVITAGTQVDVVDLNLTVFSNFYRQILHLPTSLQLINTLNTENAFESADIVQFVAGGFTQRFHIFEGGHASAVLMAKFASADPATRMPGDGVTETDFAASSVLPWNIEVAGFGDVTGDGVVTTTPVGLRLFGDGENNSLVGGGGDDFLFGRSGEDYLTGGAGGDWLRGGADDDDLRGQAGHDTLEGASGDDSLSGKSGSDSLLGGTGQDSIDGGTADDVARGGPGQDFLFGSFGKDSVFGDGGNDILIGGGGSDTLGGGLGSDVFRLWTVADSPLAAPDVVTDFSRAEGDKIDLDSIDAVTGTPTDDVFSYIADASFTNVAGQLRWHHLGSDTLIEADVDGDSLADIAIILQGNGGLDLVATDFAL
jgi:hypothetical protein